MCRLLCLQTMLGLYMADVFGFDTLQLGFLLSGQSVVYVMTQLLLFPRLVQKVGKRTLPALCSRRDCSCS